MKIKDERIDKGKEFDWGRVSKDYAKYRDIYPEEFYKKIVDLGLCIKGQKVLDLGTGTGVLPRNMYKFGAKFVGTDISENQIFYAKNLANFNNMDIEFKVSSVEDISFEDNYFDVITACQCFFYFNYKIVMPKLKKVLKPDGRIVILYMAWLPFEDEIAKASEELILKYNPKWSGARETRHKIIIPKEADELFEVEYSEIYDLKVLFTKESWHGRVKACRGIGASLSKEEIEKWEKEHKKLLDKIAPDEFDILHYSAITVMKPKI